MRESGDVIKKEKINKAQDKGTRTRKEREVHVIKRLRNVYQNIGEDLVYIVYCHRNQGERAFQEKKSNLMIKNVFIKYISKSNEKNYVSTDDLKS